MNRRDAEGAERTGEGTVFTADYMDFKMRDAASFVAGSEPDGDFQAFYPQITQITQITQIMGNWSRRNFIQSHRFSVKPLPFLSASSVV